MKKATRKPQQSAATELSFSGGVRGKYYSRYQAGTNIVVIAPDVAAIFPDSESVNRALRACGAILELAPARKRRRNRS